MAYTELIVHQLVPGTHTKYYNTKKIYIYYHHIHVKETYLLHPLHLLTLKNSMIPYLTLNTLIDLYVTFVQNYFIIKGTLKSILKDMRDIDAFQCNICVKCF